MPEAEIHSKMACLTLSRRVNSGGAGASASRRRMSGLLTQVPCCRLVLMGFAEGGPSCSDRAHVEFASAKTVRELVRGPWPANHVAGRPLE